MSEDSEYWPGRGLPTLAPQSACERARDTGRVWQHHATMASEEKLRDPCESPRSALDCAHPVGSEGADSTPVASASSISRLTPPDASGVFPFSPFSRWSRSTKNGAKSGCGRTAM